MQSVWHFMRINYTQPARPKMQMNYLASYLSWLRWINLKWIPWERAPSKAGRQLNAEHVGGSLQFRLEVPTAIFGETSCHPARCYAMESWRVLSQVTLHDCGSYRFGAIKLSAPAAEYLPLQFVPAIMTRVFAGCSIFAGPHPSPRGVIAADFLCGKKFCC